MKKLFLLVTVVLAFSISVGAQVKHVKPNHKTAPSQQSKADTSSHLQPIQTVEHIYILVGNDDYFSSLKNALMIGKIYQPAEAGETHTAELLKWIDSRVLYKKPDSTSRK
jgi:hypothetical protein